MKVKYFQDTDTLYIEFKSDGIVESRGLDENTQLDVDAEGRSLRDHHRARSRAHRPRQLEHFSLEQVGREG